MVPGDATSIDLDCGIAYARIAAWLDDELALPREAESWVFTSGDQRCFVALEPLGKRTIASIRLERTRLLVQGDADALQEFNKLFTLRFISAGG